MEEKFKLLLKPITLICVDCVDIDGAKVAMDVSMGHAKFGAAKLLTSLECPPSEFEVIKIDPIKSVEEYSKFIICELNKYVDTEFCLVIQNDGFIINKQGWNHQYYNYDYIGAPWWYEFRNVGNGGFSLRSKKLLELCSIFEFDRYHPEDDTICRLYGKKFEELGIKFAPEKIGRKFSWELNGHWENGQFIESPKNAPYAGQFGFHGKGILKMLLQQIEKEKPEHNSETDKMRHLTEKFCNGMGIDVGFGGAKIKPDAIGVDLPIPYTKVGQYKVDIALDISKQEIPIKDNSLDYVYSSHLIEDFIDTRDILNKLLKPLKHSGNLVLVFPDQQVYVNKYKGGNLHHQIPNMGYEYMANILSEYDGNIIYKSNLEIDYNVVIVFKKK